MEIVIIVMLILLMIYDTIINGYKIGYYERMLERHGFDINHVKNVTLKDIRDFNKSLKNKYE